MAGWLVAGGVGGRPFRSCIRTPVGQVSMQRVSALRSARSGQPRSDRVSVRPAGIRIAACGWLVRAGDRLTGRNVCSVPDRLAGRLSPDSALTASPTPRGSAGSVSGRGVAGGVVVRPPPICALVELFYPPTPKFVGSHGFRE